MHTLFHSTVFPCKFYLKIAFDYALLQKIKQNFKIVKITIDVTLVIYLIFEDESLRKIYHLPLLP